MFSIKTKDAIENIPHFTFTCCDENEHNVV